jgi:hypothetical protein
MVARSTTLQSKAGYIDARPLTANSTKTSCDARPDHTSGSFAEVAARPGYVRFTPTSRHRRSWIACPLRADSVEKVRSRSLKKFRLNDDVTAPMQQQPMQQQQQKTADEEK